MAGAAALMAQSGEEPASLRRQVTSPNGTTQAALEALFRDCAAEPACATRHPRLADRWAALLAGLPRRVGVIDPAKVSRLALQNAGSIAGLILTTACLIASAPPKAAAAHHALPADAGPDF